MDLARRNIYAGREILRNYAVVCFDLLHPKTMGRGPKMPFVQKNVQFNAAKQRRFNINGSAANRMERRDEGKFSEQVCGHF